MYGTKVDIEGFYLRHVIPLKDYLMLNSIGGPRPVQFRWLLNAQKGSTVLVVLALMIHYDNWSVAAYMHLANHGTFGIIWVVKDLVIPDKVWDAYMTIPSAIMGVFVLGAGWGADYIVISRHLEPPPWMIAFCTALHTFGLILLMATDTQKYFTLRYRPGVLIMDGWVKWCRNPNFLGKSMIYLSYAIMAQHWFPFAMLAFMFSFVMMSHMIVKDISLRKKVHFRSIQLATPRIRTVAIATCSAPGSFSLTSSVGSGTTSTLTQVCSRTNRKRLPHRSPALRTSPHFQMSLRAFYVNYVIPLKDYLMLDCLGGPRPVQFRQLLNAQKGATMFVLITLMAVYDNWTMSAFLNLANHGTFGLVWVLKDMVIPDKVWTAYQTIPSTILGVIVLSADWVADYIIIAHRIESPPWQAALCTAMHTLGLVLLMCTDTQKYFQLRYRPGLITDGWVKWCRNPNFLGKFLVYLSYAIMAEHWFPYAMLAFMWSFVMASHMILKDISLAKKTGGDAYIQRTGMCCPNLIGWTQSSLGASSIVQPGPLSTDMTPDKSAMHSILDTPPQPT
ncbi:hypothetical protein ACHHYP_04853 [Achlya hypogyna]|uniref:Transmembrane protein n=1 Tax=Achlya hypogyna TaxID=1202772 RepID=A0A1V9Z0D5_ACHHY|nr:hypothetical protein ACHHYP_04853 [Achlya hypogyna]